MKWFKIPPDSELLEFWNVRWREVESLAAFLDPISSERYSHTPNATTSDTGTVHIALIAALMDNYGMGGREWVSHFIYGFPFV